MGYNRYGWWNRLLGRSSVVGEDGWGSLCFVLFFFPGGRLTSVLWLFYCLLLHVVIITASVLKKRDGRKCVCMCFSTLDSDVAGVQSIPPSSSPAVRMLTDCYPLFFFFIPPLFWLFLLLLVLQWTWPGSWSWTNIHYDNPIVFIENSRSTFIQKKKA